jgi:hypothetical protein
MPERLRFPRPDRIPNITNLRTVPEIDTGAAFRPDWRMQDPAKDAKEPYGGESSGTGNDHGWSNCTMVSAALAYAFAVQDKSGPHGGDMRHNQDDLSGGTDLQDADTAFHRYGNQNLDILTGEGWATLKEKRSEGRAVIIQGEGNVPGSESFDGGHACVISPETHSDGKWLFGDPLASGWQWVSESAIRDWAENLGSGIYFAVTKAHEATDMGMTLTDVKSEPGTAKMDEDGPVWRVRDDLEKSANAGTTWQTVGTARYHDGSLGRMVRASAADGELHIVAASRVTFTPAATGGDCTDEIEQRDAEWISHLTPQ